MSLTSFERPYPRASSAPRPVPLPVEATIAGARRPGPAFLRPGRDPITAHLALIDALGRIHLRIAREAG